MGDSRGRWDGNTLVIDVTNFGDQTTYRKASATLHLIERFTRVDPDTVRVEVTVDDPTTWTRPWTFAVTGKKDPTTGRSSSTPATRGTTGCGTCSAVREQRKKPRKPRNRLGRKQKRTRQSA